jgi:hypothetical protein
MTLSDSARRILSEAAAHLLDLAAPPVALPATAREAVRRSLLKQGLVTECTAPAEQISLGWRLPDGAWTAMRITEAGRQAVAAVEAFRAALSVGYLVDALLPPALPADGGIAIGVTSTGATPCRLMPRRSAVRGVTSMTRPRT